MISSYQLSERVNAQTLLWDSCGLIVGLIRCLAAVVGRAYAVVSHLASFLPTLALALGLTLGLAGIMAAVAMIPPTFWLGLLIVGAFGWATYPRPRVSWNSGAVR